MNRRQLFGHVVGSVVALLGLRSFKAKASLPKLGILYQRKFCSYHLHDYQRESCGPFILYNSTNWDQYLEEEAKERSNG